MAKQQGPAASEQLAWVNHLPNEGGEWGHGLIRTVAAFESEALGFEADLAKTQAHYDATVAKLRAEFDKKKTALTQSIRARRKLAQDAVKRAEAESTTLYANTQIEQAKARAARAAKTAEAAEAEHNRLADNA